MNFVDYVLHKCFACIDRNEKSFIDTMKSFSNV